MYINLFGLHVLLTGATHAVGRSVALKLSEAGATLALQYHKRTTEAEELAQTLSNDSRAFQADLSNQQQLTDVFDKIVEEYGSVEILINNAGQYVPVSLSLPDDEWYAGWHQNFALNFHATTHLCRSVVNYWRKANIAGRIINISMLPPPITRKGAELAYVAAKAAMESFMRGLSQAVFADGIKTFTLIPPPLRGGEFLQTTKNVPADQLLFANPRDIAPIVVFLCSGMADYASGTTINMGTAQLQLGASSSATK